MTIRTSPSAFYRVELADFGGYDEPFTDRGEWLTLDFEKKFGKHPDSQDCFRGTEKEAVDFIRSWDEHCRSFNERSHGCHRHLSVTRSER